ncbi:unnamed protein product [Pleuronectes platessa]|uniref:Uncharacterized protein n=1 Tax=Pleuronectes platessa TaxID=8262 RepID=A0A9N7ZDL0_PLEPL|nr:unnamed protein product [Pleuronectes platessa]
MTGAVFLRVPAVLHLLDDFVQTVSPQDSSALTCQLSLRTLPRPPTLSDAVESHCQQSAPGQGGVAAGRGWLVTAAGRGTPASNSTNHHCYISLVVSSLRRQIILSSMDACVPHCSALRPPTCQDLQASLHPASPAYSCLVSNKLCSIPINYHSVSASGSDH